MAIPHPFTQPRARHETGVSQAGRQIALFWQGKVQQALDRLEAEARRMLQIEAQLGMFALQYRERVDGLARQLAALESQLGEPPSMTLIAPELLEQHACTVTARQAELKTRYRHLAKEVHPDAASAWLLNPAEQMQRVNAAYRAADMAALLMLEAQLYLAPMIGGGQPNRALEQALMEIDRASATYARGYRELLDTPLNALMLQALAAEREGDAWMEAMARKLTKAIHEKLTSLSAVAVATGIGTDSETRADVA